MGKSKRNRKKQIRPAVPAEVVSTLPQHDASSRKNKTWIAGAVVLILIGWFLFFHKGGSTPTQSVTNSSSQTPQAGLPVVQSGNTQSLSPSGSVDLQSGTSSASTGSVQ